MIISRKSTTIFVGLIVSAVILLALPSTPFGGFMRWIFTPLIQATSRFTQAFRGAQTACTSDTVSRLQDVEARLRTLRVDYITLKTLQEENQSLRAQAKFLQASGYDSVGAHVIGRDIYADRALLLIDRGSNDHLELGQAVVSDAGIFVGKISVLHERLATVELITDPQSRVAASLVGGKQLIGVLEGKGNGAATLTYIPSSEKIERDQLIVTSGTEDKITAHLPLGVINVVEGKSTDPFLRAAIEPLLPVESITNVSVLRPTVLAPSL